MLIERTDKKEAAKDFLAAYKMKEFDKLVENKSFNEGSMMDEEQYVDLYLNKDQKKILETTR